eukprot:2418207-Pleurochrysis_carterae.AAC.1
MLSNAADVLLPPHLYRTLTFIQPTALQAETHTNAPEPVEKEEPEVATKDALLETLTTGSFFALWCAGV